MDINSIGKEELNGFTLNIKREKYDSLYINVNKEKSKIKKLMTENAGVVRKKKNMITALERLTKLSEKLDKVNIPSKEKAELFNMCFVGIEILKSGIKREKSIGAHYRED